MTAAELHTLGVGVARAMTGVIVQVRSEGQLTLANDLERLHRDWTRFIARRCSELAGRPWLHETRAQKPVGVDEWRHHVAKLRAEHGDRRRAVRQLRMAKDSVNRLRREAGVLHAG